MNQPKLLAAIANVSMALGHDGLGVIAKKFGIKFETLAAGELVLFINKQRDRLKIVGGKGIVLGYIRMPKGQSLPMGAVQHISQTFSADGKIDINAAVERHIVATLAQRGDTKASMTFLKGIH